MKTQKEVYAEIKTAITERGFTEENSSVLTLQLPLNDFSSNEQFMKKIKRFMDLTSFEYVAVIEPIRESIGFNPFRPKYYEKQYYQSTSKFLPLYHAHLIVRCSPQEMLTFRENYLQIIKSKKACLFHCESVKQTMPVLINYITKFYEEKRDAEPIHFIRLIEEPNVAPATTTVIKEARPVSNIRIGFVEVLMLIANFPRKLIYKYFNHKRKNQTTFMKGIDISDLV